MAKPRPPKPTGGSSPDTQEQDSESFLGGGTRRTGSLNLFGGGRVENPLDKRGYESGDEFDLLPTNRSELVALQKRLVQLGLLSKDSFVPGALNGSTRSAFRELLTQANFYGVGYRKLLNAKDLVLDTKGGAGDKLEPRELSNPEDIKAIADEVARARLGRNLDPVQADLFVRAWQDMERQGMMALDELDADAEEFVSPIPQSAAGSARTAEQIIRFMNPAEYNNAEFNAAAQLLDEAVTAPAPGAGRAPVRPGI